MLGASMNALQEAVDPAAAKAKEVVMHGTAGIKRRSEKARLVGTK